MKRRQRGQSAVEFALMAPIVFMLIFGLIWSGIMFMEYMHYSNAIRTAAREIAVSNDTEDTIDKKKKWLEELYEKEISVKFYKPTVNITQETASTDSTKQDVVVQVELYMKDDVYNSLPNILKWLEFPPRSIKTLNYRMLSESSSSTT